MLAAGLQVSHAQALRKDTGCMNPMPPPSHTSSRAGEPLLTVLCATHLAWVLNAPILWERAQELGGQHGQTGWETWVAEAGLVWGACLLLMALAACLGRKVLLAVGAVLMVISAACAHYMVDFDVVIGYGIVQAALGSDQTMTHEVLSGRLLLWVVLAGVLPAWAWIRLARTRRTGLGIRRSSTARWVRRWVPRAAVLGVAALAFGVSRHGLSEASAKVAHVGEASADHASLAAHRYVPTNWLSGVGMAMGNRLTMAIRDHTLPSPAERFTYEEAAPLDDVTVVLVIGETTRFDHMSLFGYARETTPQLKRLRNLAAFRAESCDTSTQLSLACMFVRREAIVPGDGWGPDLIQEDKVFSVFRHLGFSVDLFATQAEAGFYHRVGPDFYKLREVIATQPGNQGKVLDGMLVPEVRASLDRKPGGRHMIVLHTKGSHFLYSQRYPRGFARWQPECQGVAQGCSREQLVNAYDNSVLYTDHVLAQVVQLLVDRPALLVFTSDHGESIDEGAHFHGTPRAIAPPEQRRVPLLVWASDALLQRPAHRAAFERLQARANGSPHRTAQHHQLFATLLGCLSIRSPDGGLTASDNLCH
jgi:KDO II ethanolaminephosphotransferase